CVFSLSGNKSITSFPFKETHFFCLPPVSLSYCSVMSISLRIPWAERIQDSSSRHAHHITEDRGQFESGLFKHFVHPIDQARTFLHQAHAQAREIPHVLLLLAGHKA